MREASNEGREDKEDDPLGSFITCADPAGSLDQIVEALKALQNYLISGGNIGRD